MRYLIFGDIHGKHLDVLEKTLNSEKPDMIICLGDFDNTDVVRQWIKIQKNYPALTVPGNHDHAILKAIPIWTSIWDVSEDEAEEYTQKLHEDLHSDKECLNFIKSLIYGKTESKEDNAEYFIFNQVSEDLKRFENILFSDKEYSNFIKTGVYKRTYMLERKIRIGNKNTVVVHGGFAGDINSWSECPEEYRPLWYRIREIQHAKENFEEMEKRGYELMIRGHDHMQQCIAKIGNNIINFEGNISFCTIEEGLYIINPGAYFDGDYAIMDVKDNIEVRFKNLR
ncbi:MAG: metallophosphoesterase family protein [Candidatus Aenigmatarchaeota archaeon]